MVVKKFLLLNTKFGETKRKTLQTKWKLAYSSWNLIRFWLELSHPNAPDEAYYTAWAYSADGTDRFTTIYPRFNLLEGTKDFSGTWTNSSKWITDGTYKGLTVKKTTGQWAGLYKTFTASKYGIYSFSTYVKSSGDNALIYRLIYKNGVNVLLPNKSLGNNFDWTRDSFNITLEAGDTVNANYVISGTGANSILWTAGHKWEEGSTATPYMPSYSEVTIADYPSYIGQYTGKIVDGQSTDPVKYNWKKI